MNLNQIRLELRGPIERSPFNYRAGVRSREKIAYCRRQIALLTKWYGQSALPEFRRSIKQFEKRVKQIHSGKL